MKQGTKRRLAPKPKRDKKSWQKRNEARKDKQDAYAIAFAQFEEDHLGVTPDTNAEAGQ